MDYTAEQNALVEPLYALDKARAVKIDGENDNALGRAFIENQLVKGGEMLAAIWITAWRNTTVDKYLTDQLAKRAAAQPDSN